MSMWTASKQTVGVGNEERGAEECLCTLARWHWMQDHVQWQMSELILGQTNHEVISFCVARIPGWERLWRELKTVWRQSCGTMGRFVPVEVSQ